VTGFSQNLIGYLTVNNGTVGITGTAHNATFTDYIGSSLFYIDSATKPAGFESE
jgi:hypothetical protein